MDAYVHVDHIHAGTVVKLEEIQTQLKDLDTLLLPTLKEFYRSFLRYGLGFFT
jgi:hypothetical protein